MESINSIKRAKIKVTLLRGCATFEKFKPPWLASKSYKLYIPRDIATLGKIDIAYLAPGATSGLFKENMKK